MGNSKNRTRLRKVTAADRDVFFKSSPEPKPPTASSSKLNSENVSAQDSSDDEHEFVTRGFGYCMWEWGQLQNLINISCVCKDCGGVLEIVEDTSRHKGWCSFVKLQCLSFLGFSSNLLQASHKLNILCKALSTNSNQIKCF